MTGRMCSGEHGTTWDWAGCRREEGSGGVSKAGFRIGGCWVV